MSANDERISNQSMDLGEFNKERLLEMFPIFRTEGGGVDFDRLKLALGESVEVGKEVFGMRWLGKADSIRLANTPSHGTLSPDEKESVNFDTTQNLIIEGDNLEALKLLQKSYQGKVKMIYIDPPYNTGNDFIYEDDFADGIKNYLQQTGQIDGEGNRLSTNTESDGRFHSNWLNMMYPRLYLAQNLLCDDGVIFMSIDDNEVNNAKSLCDTVFGMENYLNTFIWVSNLKGRQISGRGAVGTKEYVLAYSKMANQVGDFRVSGSIVKELMPSVYKGFDYQIETDERGPYVLKNQLYNTNSAFNEATRPNLVFDIYYHPVKKEVKTSKVSSDHLHPDFVKISPHRNNNGVNKYHAFRWSTKKVETESFDLEFIESPSGWTVYTKVRDVDSTALKDLIMDISTNDGSKDLEKIGCNKDWFDFPKPVDLVKLFISASTNETDVVLDFFAGSGTTAHAVMAQNAKDGGNRKFILVQLPEQVDLESEAAKAGFDNIADITKERVRRAGKKIIEESDGKLKLKGEEALDFGFRVLKLNESNIEDWNSEEASKSPKDLLDALKTTRLKTGRSEQDVVFEVLVKYGIELTSSVEELKVGKGSVWKIAGGELIVVVAPGLTNADLNAIVKMTPKVVVMLDEAFVPEALKTNARATFKDAKIELKTF
jgi:adenine-specific DNA-methyltransferase